MARQLVKFLVVLFRRAIFVPLFAAVTGAITREVEVSDVLMEPFFIHSGNMG